MSIIAQLKAVIRAETGALLAILRVKLPESIDFHEPFAPETSTYPILEYVEEKVKKLYSSAPIWSAEVYLEQGKEVAFLGLIVF